MKEPTAHTGPGTHTLCVEGGVSSGGVRIIINVYL